MKNIPVRKITSNVTDQNFPGNFSIRNVSDLLGGEDLAPDLHRHNFYLILVLKKGKGSHQVDLTHYEISDESVFFLHPGQMHRLALKKGSTGFLMQFSREFYQPGSKSEQQLLRSAGSINFYKPDPVRFKKIYEALTCIYDEYSGKEEKYSDAIKANLIILFIELTRYKKKGKQENNGSIYTQERLDEFIELLENNINKSNQVSQYARMLNLSPFQLNSMTKSALGKTASGLINEQIILEAKRYLLATAEQVKEIAYNLGFEDVSYFIRFFKKNTGQTPEVYRTNFK